MEPKEVTSQIWPAEIVGEDQTFSPLASGRDQMKSMAPPDWRSWRFFHLGA